MQLLRNRLLQHRALHSGPDTHLRNLPPQHFNGVIVAHLPGASGHAAWGVMRLHAVGGMSARMLMSTQFIRARDGEFERGNRHVVLLAGLVARGALLREVSSYVPDGEKFEGEIVSGSCGFSTSNGAARTCL